MERIWSRPAEEPGEHSRTTLISRSRTDSNFEDAYLAVEGILAGLEYKFQIHVEEPGEHNMSTLNERARSDPDFEDIYIAVEVAFRGLGARVNPSKADAGEPAKLSLRIVDPPSEAVVAFGNRPA